MAKLQWTLLISTVLLALACSDDSNGAAVNNNDTNNDNGDGDGDGSPPAALVGTWDYQSVMVDGTAADLGTVLDWVPGAVAADVIIQPNGAYVYQEVNSMGGQLYFENGFVFVNGNEVDINTQGNSDGAVDEMVVAMFLVDGDTLTLTLTEDGMTVVFTFSRRA